MTKTYSNPWKFVYPFKVTFGADGDGDESHIVIAKDIKQAAIKAHRFVNDYKRTNGIARYDFIRSIEAMDSDFVIN